MIKLSIQNTVSGLSAVCVLGVACLGHCLLRGAVPHVQADALRGVDDAQVVLPTSAAGAASDRTPCASRSAFASLTDAEEGADPTHEGLEPRTEAAYRARFVALAARGNGELESAAQRVLAGKGPTSEKVAVLRALCDTGSPRAAEILITAALNLRDVSSPQGESVPRCALRFLAERAAADVPAREALMRLAWSSEALAPGSRASAAASIAVIATGPEAWQIVRWLQVERDPLVRAAAVEALSRNLDPDASVAFRSLGVQVAAAAAGEGQD